MTGYSCSSFWLAQFFCAINGYGATGQKVFCKQISELCPAWPSDVIRNENAILELNSPYPNETFLLIYPVWQMKIEVDSFTSWGCLIIKSKIFRYIEGTTCQYLGVTKSTFSFHVEMFFLLVEPKASLVIKRSTHEN